jgi:hypothetical protein
MTRRAAALPPEQCRWKTGGRLCRIIAVIHSRGHWCVWHFTALRHPGWGYDRRMWEEWWATHEQDYGRPPYAITDRNKLWAWLSGLDAPAAPVPDRIQEAISP